MEDCNMLPAEPPNIDHGFLTVQIENCVFKLRRKGPAPKFNYILKGQEKWGYEQVINLNVIYYIRSIK